MIICFGIQFPQKLAAQIRRRGVFSSIYPVSSFGGAAVIKLHLLSLKETRAKSLLELRLRNSHIKTVECFNE
jgi:hypothetical protein